MADEASAESRKAPPGWYPHPTMADTQRYWDGAKWTDNIAPMDKHTPPSSQVPSQFATAALVALAVVGFIMAMQSASLMSGTGTLWTGVAICVGAGIVTWIVKTVPTWVRVVCILAAIGAFANASSVQSQLNDRSDQLQQQLNQIP